MSLQYHEISSSMHAMPQPDFDLPLERVADLLLGMARERALAPVLDLVVRDLAAHPDVALARIWLVREGDVCPSCPMRDECRQRVPCLHLVASAGASAVDPEADWSRLDGDFRRFPIGKRKVGHIASTAEATFVEDASRDTRWIARPGWAREEGVVGFGGQPLVYHGEVLGVLGLFTRRRFDAAALGSLRMLADHAAAAIANARSFEENARLREQLEVENEILRDELTETRAFGEILGTSPAIRRIAEQIRQVAATDASVLVLGESGTGKELVARAIHGASERCEAPIIRVNCASVPRELFESEFFGHVRGAFTGAVRDRVGRFAAAEGGTLFLDEVGEIPLELQSKLLRVLQEGQYERVGEDRTRSADVRIVAATNRSLAREVGAGRFREDLYYRLNVFPIEVPPLRRRLEDVPLLAEHFLDRLARRMKRRARLSRENLRDLQAYDWPGNVRELQNAIERALITARGGRLDFQLPRPRAAAAANAAPPPGDPGRILTDAELREIERRNLVAALEASAGRIYGEGGAAERLGSKPTTVASRIKRLGIEVRKGR